MRILALHSAGDLYGSGRILLETLDVLRAEGHFPTVILPVGGPLADQLQSREYEVFIMDLAVLRRRYRSPLGILNRVVALGVAIVRLVWLIHTRHFEIVYSNTLAVISGAIAARLTCRKHIWHIHEIIESPAILVKTLRWGLLRLSDRGICVSKAVREHWGNADGRLQEKLLLVYNGLSAQILVSQIDKSSGRRKFEMDPHALIVGMVGRIHYWKGQDYFLEIGAHIAECYPSVHLAIVGDAFPGYEYLYEELRIRAGSLGLANVVTFYGYRPDVPEFLKAIDLLVVPSTRPDPLPTVVLEGMLAGLPVVGSRIGGIPEMITDGETGVLIPHDNPTVAFELLRPLLDSAELRRDMGRAGFQRASNSFSVHAFAEGITSVFQHVKVQSR